MGVLQQMMLTALDKGKYSSSHRCSLQCWWQLECFPAIRATCPALFVQGLGQAPTDQSAPGHTDPRTTPVSWMEHGWVPVSCLALQMMGRQLSCG